VPISRQATSSIEHTLSTGRQGARGDKNFPLPAVPATSPLLQAILTHFDRVKKRYDWIQDRTARLAAFGRVFWIIDVIPIYDGGSVNEADPTAGGDRDRGKSLASCKELTIG
jgi:hypothetical protein